MKTKDNIKLGLFKTVACFLVWLLIRLLVDAAGLLLRLADLIKKILIKKETRNEH